MMKRILCCMLAALAVSSTLVSCGDNINSSDDDTSSGSSDKTTDSATTEPVDPLVEKNFNGAEINFYIWTLNNFAIDESTGDTISDAVYTRNMKVQDKYNVKFNYNVSLGHGGDWSNWINTLTSSIMADDDSIQVAAGYGYRLTGVAIGDSYHNLLDNQYIDFSQPWWPKNISEAGNLGGKLYTAIGNLDINYYDKTYAMYFNKKLADEYKLPNLYELVDNGTWTIDKLMELSSIGGRDLDGNSIMDENDQYGYLTSCNMSIDGYLQSCRVPLTDFDNNSIPKFSGLSEKYIDVYTKLKSFISNKDYVFYRNMDDTAHEFFMKDQALFSPNAIEFAHIMREMNSDFGILPYPKWDENQSDYVSYNALGNATTFVIPSTADADMVGCILEALAYYGYKDVRPQYFERALKGKVSRDNESEAMLDIIFNNIEYDFTQIYSYAFGDEKAPSMLLRVSLAMGKDIVSMYASDEKLYESTMEKLITDLAK
ncbi:MAG: hypothetical protein HFE63_08510 [Clostridiales bacterium]|nr:hypothetical protein [Clostridiales bacterium]